MLEYGTILYSPHLTDTDTNIALPGLTKAVKFPVQSIQGIEALRYILSKGYEPQNVRKSFQYTSPMANKFFQIVMGGDSCGGNLVLGIMSVIAHPHPTIGTLELTSPLAGLLLVSPWVSFESTSASFKTNATADIHMGPQMHQWARDFANEDEQDNYTEAILAPVDWWKGMQAKSVLNLSGTKELFLTDIVELEKTMKKAGVNVETVECELQVHIDCMLDAQTGLPPGDMSFAIWKWFETVF
jgi:acetyl esterase/lipase